MLFYLFLLVYVDVQPNKPTALISNNTNKMPLKCFFTGYLAEKLFFYMDLMNRVLIPFGLMVLCTGLLVYRIFDSRKRIRVPPRRNRHFGRDLRFSATSLMLNVFYLGLCLPYSILVLVPNYFDNKLLYYFLDYLTFLCFSLDFYLVFFTNSLFRLEFYKLFRVRVEKRRANQLSNMASSFI